MIALAAVLALPLLLVAAKAHGLHLRLEREAAGYHEVEFGGTNPPFVEALWAHDRVRYWSLALPLMAILAVVLYLRAPKWAVILSLPWAMSAAFLALTIASRARLRRWTRDGAAWTAGAVGLVALTLISLWP